MKTSDLLFRAAFPLAAALSSCAPIEVRPSNPEALAVMQVLHDQVEAWNRRDLDGFMKSYHNSSSTTYYGGAKEVRGFPAIAERYRNRYAAPRQDMGQLAFKNLDVEILDPSAAIARGGWHLKTATEELEGLFTLLLKKTPAGWKIAHDHTSS